MTDETLIYNGGEVKALGGGKVGGYLVRFSTHKDPDLTGDFFTHETDFFLEGGEGKAAVLYHHGLNPKLKSRRFAFGKLHLDEVGVWVEAELELRDAYEKAIYEMAEKGKLGWSSGSAPHMVERTKVGKSFHLKSWPIVEASLTPTPAEYRTEAIVLKAYIASTGDDEFDSFFEGLESDPKQSFQQHSETVATAVEERANEVDALSQQVKAWVGRVRNRLEFRELKDGRTISKPNRERLAQSRSRLAQLRESLSAIETDLDELLVMAEPKPKAESAFEAVPDAGKAMDAAELEQAMLSELATFEALRFQLTVDPSRRV